ncbi:MAG: transposase, partial [Rickettsiales bacterium]|nr:transposase [Rickettsiales bacterium]
LRKRSIIETVFGYLKNRLEIEHTRHRSPVNFLVHIFSTLVSYSRFLFREIQKAFHFLYFLPSLIQN